MKFSKLMEIVGGDAVFETGLLLAGDVDPVQVRQQLSRWVKGGRIHQLRRGLYALAPPYQKIKPHPFLVANRMVRGSYVSCQSALAHYGLIPEYVPVVVSVTTARPARYTTRLGIYEFRHIKSDLWGSTQMLAFPGEQQAFVARPEKALLDLLYLHPRSDSVEYLQELRLQNLNQLDQDALQRLAAASGSPKLTRAIKRLAGLIEAEFVEYETLISEPVAP